MSGYDFEAASFYAFFGGVGDWYFLSPEERQALHEEKLALPSFASESLAARERLKQRIAQRKVSKLNKKCCVTRNTELN
jgi:hypothetical protein